MNHKEILLEIYNSLITFNPISKELLEKVENIRTREFLKIIGDKN
jgi:hypothetical protein